MNNKVKSITFDFVQFVSVILIIFTGPFFSQDLLIVILQLTAVVIISFAICEMRRNRFYRIPDVGKQENLITSGIYKYIRNPMYLAQLLLTGALLLNYFTYIRLGIFLLLFFDFLLKIQYEEVLLAKHFNEFNKYKKISFRLIPYIY